LFWLPCACALFAATRKGRFKFLWLLAVAVELVQVKQALLAAEAPEGCFTILHTPSISNRIPLLSELAVMEVIMVYLVSMVEMGQIRVLEH
jgi:hypothetical protein